MSDVNNPVVLIDENEEVIDINETARTILGDKKIDNLSDIFENVISLKLFEKDKMKFPFKTKKGERMAEVEVEDMGGKKKITVPIEKNKWIDSFLTSSLKKENLNFDEKKDALEQIKNVEEELKKSTDLDAERSLIFDFKTTEEFNSFSDSIREKNNVQIEGTDQIENQILAVVKVTSPTREWV